MTTTAANGLTIPPQTESMNATVAAAGPVGLCLSATRPPKPSPSWQQVATVLAAAAGASIWVSAVGSGVVALRLARAGLPTEPVVALMSAEHRFTLGAALLIGPLIAGFVALLADRVAADVVGAGGWRHVLVVASLVLGGAAAYFLFDAPRETFAAELVAVLVAVPAALYVVNRERDMRHSLHEGLVIFATVLGAASCGAVVAEAEWRPPRFDRALVTRAQDAPIEAGYVTTTEHSVVLTRCRRVEAVPREMILSISVGPGKRTAKDC
jgi:hypothetical protein